MIYLINYQIKSLYNIIINKIIINIKINNNQLIFLNQIYINNNKLKIQDKSLILIKIQQKILIIIKIQKKI